MWHSGLVLGAQLRGLRCLHHTDCQGKTYSLASGKCGSCWRRPGFWLPSGFIVRLLWSDGSDRWRPVGERMPLALDAGVVCVEGFADADDVQARLIGQLVHKLRNLRRGFVCDDFLPHVAIHWRREKEDAYCQTWLVWFQGGLFNLFRWISWWHFKLEKN